VLGLSISLCALEKEKRNRPNKMKLSRLELEVLHILWTSDAPLTMQEIADRLRHHYFKKAIATLVLDNLIDKHAVTQSGVYQDFSRKTNTIPSFTSAIRFVDYYSALFEKISSRNLFDLCKWLADSNMLTVEMKQVISRLMLEFEQGK
jgi:hypothetical protein